jgi:cystathionine beta-lyase/cystathionine gamma-synthase
LVTPIFQSSTYEYTGAEDYHDLRYIRLNNTPNHVGLHAKLAALENTEAALVTASGMAAITTTLLTVLSAGDHLLAQRCLYGGTHDFLTHDLERMGMAFSFIPGDRPDTWPERLRPQTRAVYVEAMSNPMLEIPDLEAVVAFAREHKLVSIIDATFATPINIRPCELGFDLCVHSCTKYLNGHSDIVAGAVAGRTELVEPIRRTLNHLGGTLDPHACFLLNRGLKTLAVRVRQHNESALAIARFLASHPAVARVHYPGLENHPQHATAARLFDGFGGMLSFELTGGADAADRVLDRLRLPMSGPSLGGVESLITRPATTSHAGLDPEQRRELGITDGLIRFSVGLETTRDLIDDLEQALTA